MNKQEITNQLLELYTSYKDMFEGMLQLEKMNGPHLISPSKEYCDDNNVKILFVGRETNGWGKFTTVGDCMKCYEEVDKEEDHRKHPTNAFRMDISKTLGNTKTPYLSYLNCNLNRYDDDSKQPKYNDVKQFDSLVKDEVRILKPDVCIFDMGSETHSRDDRLKELFKGIVFHTLDGVDKKLIMKLEHPDLPKKSFLTAHPASRHSNDVKNQILNCIKQ